MTRERGKLRVIQRWHWGGGLGLGDRLKVRGMWSGKKEGRKDKNESG